MLSFNKRQAHTLSGPMAEAITKAQSDRQGDDEDANIQLVREPSSTSTSAPVFLGWSGALQDSAAIIYTSQRAIDRLVSSSLSVAVQPQQIEAALGPSPGSTMVAPAFVSSIHLTFSESEYEALGLGGAAFQPEDQCHFGLPETVALFGYCGTYGSSNMPVVSDRMGSYYSTSRFTAAACAYRYYSCAREILSGRVGQLKVAASASESPSLSASLNVLIAALTQHPLLVPTAGPSGAATSKGASTSSVPYFSNYHGALRYEARLQAAMRVDPSADGGQLDNNVNSTTSVMRLKSARVYRALAAAHEACLKRAEEEPTMGSLIASIEDKATIQLERVLEGVREGVRAPASGVAGSVMVSESPYAVGAPDLVSSEHMLLTLSTKAHKSSLAKKKPTTATAGPTQQASPSPSAKRSAAKRARQEEEPVEESAKGPSDEGANYFSQLLLQSEGGTLPDAATTAQFLHLMSSPALPIPTPLHLELEDKLEETLIGDPMALTCSCTGCRAAMDIVRSRLMRCVLLRRALSRTNSTLALAQKLCLDELAPVLGAISLEAVVIDRDTNAS